MKLMLVQKVNDSISSLLINIAIRCAEGLISAGINKTFSVVFFHVLAKDPNYLFWLSLLSHGLRHSFIKGQVICEPSY